MGSRCAAITLTIAAAATCLLFAASVRAQSLGHRVPGTVGIHAGDQPGAGIHLVGQFLNYASRNDFDRDGNRISDRGGFALDAVAGALGIAATFRLPRGGPYLGVALGLPGGYVSGRIESTRPRIERGGIGDLYFQPVHIGARLRRADLTASFAMYFPTGRYDANGRQGFGNGQVTYELNAGGTVFFDDAHRFFLSALGSFDINGPKQSIAITRGAVVLLQGGAGARVFDGVDLGVAAYGLWQVSDDSGSALPQPLRGAREYVYGVGPEIDVMLPQIPLQLSARYGRDIAVQNRPQGEVLFVSLVWRVHRFGAASSRRGDEGDVVGGSPGLSF